MAVAVVLGGVFLVSPSPPVLRMEKRKRDGPYIEENYSTWLDTIKKPDQCAVCKILTCRVMQTPHGLVVSKINVRRGRGEEGGRDSFDRNIKKEQKNFCEESRTGGICDGRYGKRSHASVSANSFYEGSREPQPAKDPEIGRVRKPLYFTNSHISKVADGGPESGPPRIL